MINYITHIKDTIGNNYLGINIDISIINPFLNELRDIIGGDFEEFTTNQQNRDHGTHHLTVINVADYNRLSKGMGIDKFINSLDYIFKFTIDDIKLMGVGTAERNGNRAYFIVVQSDKLDAIRDRYDLPKHDFHITLGFKHKDVFGVRKNEVIKKESKFLKLLSLEFYKSENWNFIRKISNFDLNPMSEIIPVLLNNSILRVKCDGYFLDISWLEDGEKFWVCCKYPIDEDMPRISETEISKLLKNKN